jgi:RNA polymerase sigma-70 factor, ECF subfamily
MPNQMKSATIRENRCRTHNRLISKQVSGTINPRKPGIPTPHQPADLPPPPKSLSENRLPLLMPQITELLNRVADGDRRALDELSPLVYEHLHSLAENCMRREKAGHMLQPTALLHDAWLRLAAGNHPRYLNRAHFYAVVVRLMRGILVDHARAKQAVKRGGGASVEPLSASTDSKSRASPSILQLDDAMKDLSVHHALKARLVELRFFGGFTLEEMAASEGLSLHQIRSELRLAEAWLRRNLAGRVQRDNPSQTVKNGK